MLGGGGGGFVRRGGDRRRRQAQFLPESDGQRPVALPSLHHRSEFVFLDPLAFIVGHLRALGVDLLNSARALIVGGVFLGRTLRLGIKFGAAVRKVLGKFLLPLGEQFAPAID